MITRTAFAEGPKLLTQNDSTFTTTFNGIPVAEASDGFDPMVFHKRHFSDGQYRMIFKNDPFGIDETQLWKTSDFSTYTKVSNSIAGNSDQFEDHIVLPDGTFVLYQSPTQDGGTSVWTGTSLTNLTKLGTPIPEPDGGVFYDEANETIHIYTEDQDHTTGPGSDKLSHWTTPDDDLLNATQQRDAIDLTSVPWHTGDPDIIQMSGTYYMFTDQAINHPYYRIAVFRSDNLQDWTLFQKNINPQRSGGDMVVTRYNGSFVGFTEYDNYAEDQDFGVGQWQVSFVEDETDQNVQVALEGGGAQGLDRSFTTTAGAVNQPVGVLQLQPEDAGVTLESLAVRSDGSSSSGVERIRLYSSTDNAFDASEDTRLAEKSVTGGQFPSELSFTGLSHNLGIGRYIFLTTSLAESAGGDVSISIQSESEITLAQGQISSVNGTDESTFDWLPLSSSPSTLPVELTTFRAELVGDAPNDPASHGPGTERSVQLRWQTASETGNAGFAVERRRAEGGSAVDGGPRWETVGFVEARTPTGTTTEPKSYRYLDERIPFAADSLSYRLRQVDINGRTTFSSVVTVARQVSEIRLLSTHPNPVRTRLTVQYSVPQRSEITLTIYDVLGRKVRTAKRSVVNGRRTEVLGVSDLSSGVYVLRLRGQNSVTSKKFTVVR